jgi:hypothetical protein
MTPVALDLQEIHENVAIFCKWVSVYLGLALEMSMKLIHRRRLPLCSHLRVGFSALVSQQITTYYGGLWWPNAQDGNGALKSASPWIFTLLGDGDGRLFIPAGLLLGT